MSDFIKHLPPALSQEAEEGLARGFRGARKGLLRALLRAPGGLQVLDAQGAWGRLPAAGAPRAELRAFAGRVRKTRCRSTVLCEAARTLAPSLEPAVAADLRARVTAVEGLRDALMEGSLQWVGMEAKHHAWKLGNCGNEDLIGELFQQACLELQECLERFDPARARLRTFAAFPVKDAFLEVQNQSKVFTIRKEDITGLNRSRQAAAELAKLLQAVRDINLRHRRPATPAEAAAALGWPEAKVRGMEERLEATLSVDELWSPRGELPEDEAQALRSMPEQVAALVGCAPEALVEVHAKFAVAVPLEVPGEDGEGTQDHPGLVAEACRRCPDPAEAPEQARMEALDAALAGLPDLERRVLELTFGLQGRDAGQPSFQAVARQLGLTRRQVEAAYHRSVDALQGRLGAFPRGGRPAPRAEVPAGPQAFGAWSPRAIPAARTH